MTADKTTTYLLFIVTITFSFACNDHAKNNIESHSQELSDNDHMHHAAIFSSRLPAIKPTHNHCMDKPNELDVFSWVEASDAVVVGTIKEISETLDYGWVGFDDYQGERVLPGEQCVEIGGGFRIILEDVITLSGTSLSEVEIRFGSELPWESGPVAADEDGDDSWLSRQVASMAPGMKIGGALFYIPEYEIYSFESAKYQPIFEIVDDVVLFQQVYSAEHEVCAWHLPPVSLLNGLSLSELEAEIEAVADGVDRTNRQSNPLRQFLQLDVAAENSPERRTRWFSSCLPADYDTKN